ncbi:peptidoglycan-binding domain-containing protein [Streptomyces kanamyceticus]|uniref:Peptidoglycan-binding protein n=1 Tax=Streptomyces kanamyceticus TaxID=1967 RepID=A0A5J6GLE3_STRKN|nr:peptidoglycan-binding domain-containing protein [Streptomyces kanamyceticus]QEU94638.1 peptidoglycan-binding protein [Streptomyces kanamyceticus]
MGGESEQRCPECGATRAAGSAPECGCTRRAAEQARRTRSTEAAAAEDFDPLRIRPYVSLPEPEGPPEPADVRLFAAAGGREGTAETAPSPAYEEGAGAPAEDRDGRAGAGGNEDGSAARKRRYVLLAGALAVAAVTAAAIFTTGLFSSAADRPTRDLALPDAPTAAAPRTPASPAPSSAERPSLAPSHAPSVTPTPTPSATRPPPSPSRSERRTAAPPSLPTARATGSVGTSKPSRGAGAALREGDEGPRVKELQGRLAQLYLYVGEPDGTYGPEVTDAVTRYQWARGLTRDRLGEYGDETRRSLESETSEP